MHRKPGFLAGCTAPRAFFCTFVFLSLFPSFSAAMVTITEIMYDPPVNESYDEWIEVYNAGPDTVSLENWTLCNVSILKGFVNQSDGKTYSALGFDLLPGYFAVITDGGTGTLAYAHYSISGLALHTAASTLCGGLSNNNDTLVLGSPTASVSVYYTSSMGGSNNNRTVCAYPESSQSLQECVPTPGYANIRVPKISVNLTAVFTEGVNISIFTIASSPCRETSLIFQYNMTNATFSRQESFSGVLNCSLGVGSFYPVSSGNLTLCWSLSASAENQSGCSEIAVISASQGACSLSVGIAVPNYANASQSFEYFLELNNTQCDGEKRDVSVDYWIDDLFGNTVKDPVTTVQQMVCYKSVSRDWTPPDIKGSEVYVILANASSPGCTSASASSSLPVKGSENAADSYIKVIDYDNVSKFGDAIDVELEIYRGSTNKYAVDVWTETGASRSSAVTTVHAKEKYTTYWLKVPVLVKQNCDGSLPAGEHTLIVSGLDVNKSVALRVEGLPASCQTQSSSQSSSSGSSSGGGSSSYAKKEPADTIVIDLISYQDSLFPGDEPVLKANINNLFSSSKSVSVYSYIFKGSSLATENGWVPNAVKLTMNPHQNYTINLTNKVKDDVSEGLYYLRLRVRADKDYDKTVEVAVSKPSVEKSGKLEGVSGGTHVLAGAANSSNSTNSTTASNAPNKTLLSPPIKATGFAVSSQAGGKRILEYVLNVHFFSLFRLLIPG